MLYLAWAGFELTTLVVHRSSKTLTNQSDVNIQSDDQFLNLVADSDSIVSKIYMLNFVLWLFWFFFLSPYWQKYCSFIPAGFLPLYWQTSGNFVQAYFWHSVNTHIWTSLLLVHLDQRSRWTIAITWRLSSVVCRLNFSHFKLLLRNHWADWNQT